MSDLVLTWRDIHWTAEQLAARLKDQAPDREWTGIVAVTTGGMVPACLVAKRLGIKHIETYCFSSYEGQVQGSAHVLKTADLAAGGAGWLVIDDLTDTGKTFRHLRKTLPEAYYATLYVKPEGAEMAQSYAEEIPQETWIHFPWELAEKAETEAEIRAGLEKL